MEAKDLMIGDWVQVPSLIDNVEHYNGCCKVKQLRDNDLDVIGFKELGYDEIDPIPLTTEILEKNGFTKMFDFKGKNELLPHYESEDGRIEISNQFINSNNEWNVHVDTEDMSSMANCEITYVHELQHVLRLCGIEKEIEI